MVRREFRQRSVFEVLLPDADKLWDSHLRRIDEVLSDEELVELVAAALGKRRPKSQILGRPGTPAEVVLRMLVLKHLYDWSFEECEREVRGSLVYRAFCRIDCERVPDAKSLIRLSHVLGPAVLKAILERLVTIARKRRMIRGLRMRVDTTVVETNVHYPTDSTLLADGVRVITRTIKKISQRIERKELAIRDRSRSLARRVFQIGRQSRQVTERAKQQIQKLYREVTRIARAVIRDAQRALDHVATKTPRGLAAGERVKVEGLVRQIRETVALTRRVLAQTRARVFHGNTHYPDKVLSIFEPHTEAIRKGKAAKPTEFGKMIKIQEAEAQFITDYEVSPARVPDQDLWVPSLAKHQRLFAKPPRLATADAAFASAANESTAKDLGVKQVALPRRGRLSKTRLTHQKQRWFRRALRWRTGSEGRISTLKRRHGLSRCRYRGYSGMQRWVGLGVIANNLWALGET
jgi:transposase, IS5 family